VLTIFPMHFFDSQVIGALTKEGMVKFIPEGSSCEERAGELCKRMKPETMQCQCHCVSKRKKRNDDNKVGRRERGKECHPVASSCAQDFEPEVVKIRWTNSQLPLLRTPIAARSVQESVVVETFYGVYARRNMFCTAKLWNALSSKQQCRHRSPIERENVSLRIWHSFIHLYCDSLCHFNFNGLPHSRAIACLASFT
jgi:hypothetical protein